MQAELRIENIRLTRNGTRQRLSADFVLSRKRKVVWFETDQGMVNNNAEVFLPVALIPAMRRNWQVVVDGAISPQLMLQTRQIQQLFQSWYKNFSNVSITASELYTAPVSNSDVKPVACFFSGGVDSFFTLKSHLDKIDQLIFIHGFDIPLRQHKTNIQAAESVRLVAKKLGIGLVEVTTNLRSFGQGHVSWPHAYFGAGLAAVALLLAPRFKQIYLPASVSVDELVPMGSHPDLDKLWSSSGMQIIHDGIESTRFQKIETVANWAPVGEHLRVCYSHKNGGTNCGRCRKCLWTMMVLRAIGKFDTVTTFPRQLDLDELKLYVPSTLHERNRYQEALDRLNSRNADPELTELLANMLAANGRTPWQGKLKRLMIRIRIYLAHRIPVMEKKQ